MAESDPPKSAGPAAGVPESQGTPSEDGLSLTRAPDDDDSTALTDWSAGQVILDDYVVERELGAGGMGKVYLLRSRSTGQPFAVKRALLRSDESRRQFLAELRTWIDLPEHPHLVACRFFRTVGDEVVIFAEFVEGGSLADWIRDRRLTSLEQILDVAIQFAWGLHAAHELGLVHQDVKPGNALMTPNGQLKVADFGLARGRAAAAVNEDAGQQRPDVTSYAGTPAYQSPEQAAGERLTLATDVWSWGLAVLEMFGGERSWMIGVAAADALQAYLKRPADPDLPAMPSGVAEVLQKCFRADPAERWVSLAEAADASQHAYRQAVGNEYPRPNPAAPDPTRQAVVTHDRRTTQGGYWHDPREWLIEAFEADGRDPAGVEAFLSARAGSRKAQAITDLAAYEEAQRIFERLIAEGRNDLKTRLANLCFVKAVVHRGADDMPGAVAQYDRAVAIFERQEEFADGLAASCVNKAVAVSELGDHRAAVALYDRAIAIYERLVDQEESDEVAIVLAQAQAFMNKANAVRSLGDHRAAVALYDRAITIYERLVNSEGRAELANHLALACMNKAILLRDLGNNSAAVALYDRAIAIYDSLSEEGRQELAAALAMACRNKGIAVSSQGDHRGAVAVFDRAIAIYERLVESEGRQELTEELAKTIMNKGTALHALGDNRAVLALFDQAIPIYEQLVGREGRRELVDDLAAAIMDKGVAQHALGDNRAAVALFDRAIAMRERLVMHEGRQELQGDLAWVVASRAEALLALGDHQQARSEARKAIPILQAEIARTGRADLQRALDEAVKDLHEVL